MLYPLTFEPIFQERIWGGRELERLYHKKLPGSAKIGESWEIVDREEAQSVIANGPLTGKTLHWVMTHHRAELMGLAKTLHGRFPLLVKILDARDKLSLQVHPPAEKAKALGGEPKTEMWYITMAEPGAELYVGLKKGIDRAQFEKAIREKSVASCFHRVAIKGGAGMFLPSGRVHAIGAGLVLFEIQQNSDTTYRVYDWDRVDPSGKPRQLHVQESLESIDFEDFEPLEIAAESPEADSSSVHIRSLVEHELFNVEAVHTQPDSVVDYRLRAPRIVGVVEGEVQIDHETHPVALQAGQFALIPACLERVKLVTDTAAEFLVAQPGLAG